MFPSNEEIVSAHRIEWCLKLQRWLNHEIRNIRFYVILLLTFLPWLVWWKLVDKKRIAEILMFGLVIVVLTTTLDMTGREVVLWSYPYELLPMVPLLEIDFGILPVLYMLIYQYCVNWKAFVLTNVVAAAIYSFILEPLYVKGGFYVMHNWKPIYSFPIYILMAVSAKWLSDSVIRIQTKNRTK